VYVEPQLDKQGAQIEEEVVRFVYCPTNTFSTIFSGIVNNVSNLINQVAAVNNSDSSGNGSSSSSVSGETDPSSNSTIIGGDIPTGQLTSTVTSTATAPPVENSPIP